MNWKPPSAVAPEKEEEEGKEEEESWGNWKPSSAPAPEKEEEEEGEEEDDESWGTWAPMPAACSREGEEQAWKRLRVILARFLPNPSPLLTCSPQAQQLDLTCRPVQLVAPPHHELSGATVGPDLQPPVQLVAVHEGNQPRYNYLIQQHIGSIQVYSCYQLAMWLLHAFNMCCQIVSQFG